ncbi:hypothetical protein JXA32_04735 [Candidatus Sumerlaeota bacterium]|nr:hypothetical protein [Candidatus Sumerlaeota bacterium]
MQQNQLTIVKSNKIRAVNMNTTFMIIFIAVAAFIVISGVTTFIITNIAFFNIFGLIRKRMEQSLEQNQSNPASGQSAQIASFRSACKHCSSAIEDGSLVSPSGDYKCPYCGKWSNVHA